MINTATNRVPLLVGVVLGCVLVLAPRVTQAQEQQAIVTEDAPTTFYACYVPTTGLVYRIREEGLNPVCLAETHVEFSWPSGGVSQADPGDGPVRVVMPDNDGFAATGTFNVGNIPVSGPGVRMMFYPKKAAFRSGQVLAGHWNNGNIGPWSTATGFNTVASGSFATALGRATTASGSSSMATGFHAVASGHHSTALGQNTTAGGPNSTALGLETRASGNVSTSLGGGTRASGPWSTAMGQVTHASAGWSTAMGYNTTASGLYSTAMGRNTTASKGDATAMGHVTTASGSISTAMSYRTTASHFAAIAMGNRTTASGHTSTAMGFVTTASGQSSVAMGQNTTASGSITTAMGEHTTAQAFASLVLGRYNAFSGNPGIWQWSDPVLVVGNGTVEENRRNAFTLLKDGNLTIAGTLTENSDVRLKQDIQPLGGVLSKLTSVRGVSYRFTDGNGPAGQHVGLLAQEVQQAFPALVHEDSQGELSVAYGKFTAVLLEAIKEQQERIANLEATVHRLEVAMRGVPQ